VQGIPDRVPIRGHLCRNGTDMEIGQGWEAWGLPGLFLAAFLAATILPFSSEALLGAMALGDWSGSSLLIVASIGNTLGGLTNYGLGRWFPEEKAKRWFRMDATKAERWQHFVHRRGAWAALLCWLPVVGDPIAIALGLFRAPFLPVAVLMFIGKCARYGLILGIMRAPAWW
jgi:membrane protein YqaA with SNARE-associated domain